MGRNQGTFDAVVSSGFDVGGSPDSVGSEQLARHRPTPSRWVTVSVPAVAAYSTNDPPRGYGQRNLHFVNAARNLKPQERSPPRPIRQRLAGFIGCLVEPFLCLMYIR